MTACATFYAVQGGNDLFWRCEAPAREIGAREEILPEEDFAELVTHPHDTPPFRWHLRVDWPEGHSSTIKTKLGWKRMYRQWPRSERIIALFPDHEGTAVWIRPDLSRAQLAKSMREQHGWRVISEVDDNYMMDPRLSFFLRSANWTPDKQAHHLRATFSTDAVVFSTADLRDIYLAEAEAFRQEQYSRNGSERPPIPELHVCRNHVPEADWPQPIPREGRIRVGWMGSPSHIWDVDLAWPALRYADMVGGEVWMIGYDPVKEPIKEAGGEQFLSPRAFKKVQAWKRLTFKTIPWRKPAKYERVALPLDIGLCPLRTDSMTLGKSDVKALEYWVNGACPVAWNNGVYNKTVIHGENGLLAGSPSEMIDAVRLLIRDENLRQRLVEAGQQYVREERGSRQMREEWGYAITG